MRATGLRSTSEPAACWPWRCSHGSADKDSTGFGRDDLLLVAKVADLAHTWIFGHNQSSPDDGSGKF